MKPVFRVLIFISVLVLQLENVQPLLAQQVTFKKMPGIETIGSVPAITQDPRGIVWFITAEELDSYDGYTVTSYKHDALNPNTPTGFRPECVYADRDGIIWIGNFGGGLDRYDPLTGVFSHYRHDAKDANSIGHDIVTAVFEDRDKNLWVGTHGGLDRLDRKTGKFTHYIYNEKDPASLSNNQVRAIYQDREGTLWIGTGSPWIGSSTTQGENGVVGEGGLNKMDIKSGKFVRYLHDPKNPHSLINNKVRAIFEDSHGNFWIGTADDGLHIMDRKTGSFQRYTYDPQHPEKLSRAPLNKQVPYDHITFITEDQAGAIWIGTAAGGVSRYDAQTKRIKHYDNDTLSGFNDNSPFGAFISRDGLLWITTLNGNVFSVSPFSANIPHFAQNNGSQCFYLDKDSVLWMGTAGSGLIKRDLKNKTQKQIIPNGAIYHIANDAAGNLWVAVWPDGLYKLNLQTENLTHYKHDNGNSNSLVNDTAIAVCIDPAQNVWIGTIGGLDKFDPNAGIFTHYRYDAKDSASIRGTTVYCIAADKDGNVWAGGGDNIGQGINKWNAKTGKFSHYLEGERIFNIMMSSTGTLFAGGLNNLYQFDSVKNNFIPILDPLTGKSISTLAMVEDEQQNLWLSAGSGLLKLDIKKRESFAFGKKANVDPVSLFAFAAYKDNRGKLYFGNTSGYYSFDPSELLKQAKGPEILFTSFSLGKQILRPSEHGPLKIELWKTDSLSLNHDQNIFSFEFVPIDYNDPAENRLLYKLENYDDEWRATTIPGKAYYFNIPPGKYIFKVKASSSFGVWSEKNISITISPPWWRTWWAYCLYGVLFVALVLSIHRYQRSRVLKKERERTRRENWRRQKKLKKLIMN